MSRGQGERRTGGGVPSWAIRRPIGTIMLSSVIIVLGFFFLSGLPLDLLPSIVYTQVREGVSNQGVEPQVLEETIAKPLEAALATTEDDVKSDTQIKEGRVWVDVHVRQGMVDRIAMH